MSAPAVRSARHEEAEALAGILVEAFQRDPLAHWLYPDPQVRRDAHRSMFLQAVAETLSEGFVDVTEDGAAVALWRRTVEPIDPSPPPRATAEVATLFRKIAAAAPAPSYWALAFIGARTSGGGRGGTLMRHGLARLGGAAWLWTGNERNLGFYARHGFSPRGRVDVPGASAWWLARTRD